MSRARISYDDDFGEFDVIVFDDAGKRIASRGFAATSWYSGGEPALPREIDVWLKRFNIKEVEQY